MKSILVFSSVLFISIAALFPTNNVIVTSSLPNYAKPGQTVDFSITVSKGELGGFSKLNMDLPDGFEVEALETKGGTFSFTDQELKIIWVSLPSEPKFNLTFKVKIASSVKGSFPLDGQFSYIQDGQRTDSKFNTNIFVSSDEPAAIADNKAAKEIPSEVPDETTLGSNSAEGTAGLEFTRNLSNLNLKPSESTIVKLVVGKKGISGFGKITEIIPEGFTAKEVESNGGIFSVLNNEVRFLWMTLPAADSFEVSYKLIASNKKGEHSIKGSFSYVEDTKTKLNSTSATIFNVGEDELVASVTPEPADEPIADEPIVDVTPEAASSDPVTPEPEATASTETIDNNEGGTTTENEFGTESTARADTDTDEPTETTTATSTASTSSEASSQPGEVSYRVQICATRKAVDKQYFTTNNQVNEEIYADMHNGWHKFTVGAFDVYGEARNHRENVKEYNKIKGPFVTAYNSGDRITVQEALMISKQQWVP